MKLANIRYSPIKFGRRSCMIPFLDLIFNSRPAQNDSILFLLLPLSLKNTLVWLKISCEHSFMRTAAVYDAKPSLLMWDPAFTNLYKNQYKLVIIRSLSTYTRKSPVYSQKTPTIHFFVTKNHLYGPVMLLIFYERK